MSKQLLIDPKTLAPIPANGMDAVVFQSLEDPADVEELRLAQATRGQAFLDGRIRRRAAREWIEISNEEADRYPGAAWLVQRRIRNIARVIGAEIPLPLFAPPTFKSRGTATILGVVSDLCAWATIPVFLEDPEREFEAPVFVPVASYLDTIEALGYSRLSYSSLARARRVDALLNEALMMFRGHYRYAARPLLRWLLHEKRERGT
jgi:hypothetical protein